MLRFSRRPLGEAVSVPLHIEMLWKLDRRAYGPHYWRATTSCSQRNRCFSQCPFFSMPRLIWPPIGLWFLPALLLNVHLPGEEKTGQMWEQACNGHTSCWRNGNGENEREWLFSLYICLQKAHKNIIPSFECVCLIQGGEEGISSMRPINWDCDVEGICLLGESYETCQEHVQVIFQPRIRRKKKCYHFEGCVLQRSHLSIKNWFNFSKLSTTFKFH